MQNSYLIKPNPENVYPTIARGEGVYLYDTLGKKYFDGCSGAIAANIGHGVKAINEAAMKQLDKIAFSYRSQFTNEPAEQLAKFIVHKAPGMNYCSFVNSGSEAVEATLRFSIAYWKNLGQASKQIILSRHNSYHGSTLATLKISGHIERREPLSHLFTKTNFVNSTKSENALQNLEDTILRIGEKNIAAFIVEPVVGASGAALVPPDDYLQGIRTICNNHNILLIADEVMTGMGRTGAWYGCNHWNLIPDIIALGKGIAAGYAPIAAVLINDKVYSNTKSIHGLGHTYSANPLSCAIGLAVLKYIENNNLINACKVQGKMVMQQLFFLADQFAFVQKIRGKGLQIGFDLVNSKTKQPYDPNLKIAKKLTDIAMELGLIVYPCRSETCGDSIMLAPPFTISNSEILELIYLLRQTFQIFETELIKSQYTSVV